MNQYIKRICSICGRKFGVYPCRIRAGGGNYCSKLCFDKKQTKRVDSKCIMCGKSFTVTLSGFNRGEGKYCSQICYRKSILGRGSHFYKNGNSKIERKCVFCGKIFYSELNRIKNKRGLFCSNKCRYRYYSGINAVNWRGGLSKNIKRLTNRKWKIIRLKIYKRDNWKCQNCGKKCYEDIQCRHIIPYRNSKNNSLYNLITLCKSCHIKKDRIYEFKMKSKQKCLNNFQSG